MLRGEDVASLPSNPRLFWQRLAEMAGSTGRPGDLTIYVDGFRSSVRLPPRETIEMIRIDANPFAAEFQEPGKGRVEIVTKPGSDAFFGQLALNFSDEVLNARNAFVTEQPSEQYRRYSGYVGGPIVPGRWSLLVYGGRWEQDENAVVYATTIDRVALQPTTVTETVPNPFRTTSLAIKAHSVAGAGNIATMMYERRHQTSGNLGVGGYNLPEHAFDQTTAEDVGQFSLTSISSRRLNDFRIDLTRRIDQSRARVETPEVIVFDAFTAGGNQLSAFRRGASQVITVSEAVTQAVDRHTVKAGVALVGERLDDTNRANFGGQFMFGGDFERDAAGRPLLDGSGRPLPIPPLEAYRRTLAGLPGYGPSQFVVNRGDPEARLGDARVAWFVQDDWRLRPNLTIAAGLRQDVQTQLDGGVAIAPRVGVAWGPDRAGLSTIRVGAGLFFAQVPAQPLLDTVRLDGRRQQQVVVQEPTFFPAIPAVLASGEVALAATVVRDPRLAMTRLGVTSVAYERQLPAGAFVSSGYAWRRGSRLLRSRNVNAPRPGSASGPLPELGPILQLEATGSSSRHEIDVRWRQNLSSRATTYATYILGSSRADTDGPTTVPANSYDLAPEFGRAADDVRHQLVAGGTVSLPGGWSLSLYATASSAPPFNITTGRDNNDDTLFTDRPAPASPRDAEAIATRFGVLNPSAAPGDRIIPRNFGRQAGRVDLSFSVLKPLSRRVSASADVTNLLNKTHRTAFNGVLGASDFGQATQALPARHVEIGVTARF